MVCITLYLFFVMYVYFINHSYVPATTTPAPRYCALFYSILVAQAIMGCLPMMSLVTSPMRKQLKWPFYYGPVKCKRPSICIYTVFKY